MPGHKGKRIKDIRFSADNDVTELPVIDNERIMAEAEKDIAEILGAEYCRILTDGSTCGILSMVYAVRDLGKKLIIFRPSHKSVYNAIKLSGIEPVIISGEEETVCDEMTAALKNEDGVIGALITYPDYYGNAVNIAEISKVLKSHGKLLLVDGAHGGHFRFLSSPAYAGDYADVWVDGAHKTLYTFNQGALILGKNVGLKEKVFEALNVFSTTSPSYIIAASVEYGIKALAENGNDLLRKLKGIKADAENKLFKAGFKVEKTDDPFKTVIDFAESGYDSDAVNDYLGDNNIFAELNDGRKTVFMYSAETEKREIKKLVKALTSVKFPQVKSSKEEKVIYGERAMSYSEATESEILMLPLKDAVGKICAENFGVLPPCVPLATAGERITESETEKVLKAKFTFGVYDGKVKTVRERE